MNEKHEVTTEKTNEENKADTNRLLASASASDAPASQDARYLAHVWQTVVENGYLTREFIEKHTGVISAATTAAVVILQDIQNASFRLWWDANQDGLANEDPEDIAFLAYMKALHVAGYKLENQQKMKAFINDLFKDGVGDLDGFDLQELGEKHGVLNPVVVHEPCSDVDVECECAITCSDSDFVDGMKCYRLAEWLKASTYDL